MPKISVKDLRRKLQRSYKYKSASFKTKAGDTIDFVMVYFEVFDNGWCPEMLYIDNDVFKHIDITNAFNEIPKSELPKEFKRGIIWDCLRYDSIYAWEGKCFGYDAFIISHQYYIESLRHTNTQPLFVVMNEKLLNSSDIKKQFYYRAKPKKKLQLA